MSDELIGGGAPGDAALTGAWMTLEPGGNRRRRIDTQVSAWLDAHDTSLVAEWLSLFKVAPLPAFGLATASALSIATAPPLLWFALALL